MLISEPSRLVFKYIYIFPCTHLGALGHAIDNGMTGTVNKPADKLGTILSCVVSIRWLFRRWDWSSNILECRLTSSCNSYCTVKCPWMWYSGNKTRSTVSCYWCLLIGISVRLRIMASWYGNVFRTTGHFWRESTAQNQSFGVPWLFLVNVWTNGRLYIVNMIESKVNAVLKVDNTSVSNMICFLLIQL